MKNGLLEIVAMLDLPVFPPKPFQIQSKILPTKENYDQPLKVPVVHAPSACGFVKQPKPQL